MAPYRSDAQRKRFHAMLERGEISKATVDEWDKASAGMKLPERVTPKQRQSLLTHRKVRKTKTI